MREIKFRSWLKLKNEMLYSFTSMDHPANSENEKRVLMQYTGIKTFDGEEIYEGDIVEELCSSTPRKFEVVWDDYGMFLFSPLSETNSGAIDYFELEDEVGEIVIVGNIYENPELLEVCQ